MKILQHICLMIFLICMSGIFGGKVFAIDVLSSTGAVSEQEGENEQIETVDNNEEQLLFDQDSVSEEIELNSASDINDQDKTIRELEAEKEQLITDKEIVTKNFNDFILNNGKLREYFKSELTPDELLNVEEIIVSYNNNRIQSEMLLKDTALQGDDTEAITEDLLELKKELYISFLPFIIISKLDEYKQFIKADFTATKKDKKLQSDIYKKEKIVEDKKIIIQEKIDASEQDLEEKKAQVITSKINQKLSAYSQSDKFKLLNTEQKSVVFTKVLEKITEKRTALEESQEGVEDTIDSHKRKKIKLYRIVELTLSDFIAHLE